MKTTLYLAGPMSGLPNFNAAEFDKWAAHYRAQGFFVISPAETDGRDYSKPREYYMRHDIGLLLYANVQRIYMLPGWRTSRGARLEHHVAEELGIPIYDATTGRPLDESLLLEAHQIVHGERGEAYGHPLIDFGRTTGMLNALLKHKLVEPLVEEDIPRIMIAVKLSRDTNRPSRDSLMDIAGYAETMQMVRDERKRRQG